jgi:hypothetical protein
VIFFLRDGLGVAVIFESDWGHVTGRKIRIGGREGGAVMECGGGAGGVKRRRRRRRLIGRWFTVDGSSMVEVRV